jgi:hypothetical protein
MGDQSPEINISNSKQRLSQQLNTIITVKVIKPSQE